MKRQGHQMRAMDASYAECANCDYEVAFEALSRNGVSFTDLNALPCGGGGKTILVGNSRIPASTPPAIVKELVACQARVEALLEKIKMTRWWKKKDPSADIIDAVKYLSSTMTTGPGIIGSVQSSCGCSHRRRMYDGLGREICGPQGCRAIIPIVDCILPARPAPMSDMARNEKEAPAPSAAPEPCICFGPRSLRCRAHGNDG